MEREGIRPRGLPNWAWVCALTLAALALRLFRLDFRSIWLDEAYSLNLAQADWAGIIQGARLDIHPPLYHLVLAAWIRAFGTSEFAVRALSAALGALLVPVAFRLAEDLADRRAAWWAAGLLAVSPYFLELARSARMGSMLVLFGALSLYFFLQVIRGRPMLFSVGYVLSTLAALYTHYFAFLLLFTQSFYLFMGLHQLRLPRPVRQRWLYLQLLLLAGYAPWIPSLWQHLHKGGPAWRGTGASWLEPFHSLYVFALGTACWTLTAKLLALCGLAAAAGIAAWKLLPAWRQVAERMRTRDWGLLATVIFLPLVLVFIYSQGRLNVFDNRYLGFCALAGLVIGAVLLTSLPRRAGWLAGALVLAAFAVPACNQYFVYGYYDNWRAASAQLLQSVQPQDEVAVYPAWNETPLQYYLRTRLELQGLPGRYDPVFGPTGNDFPIDRSNVHQIQSIFNPAGRFWLVLVGTGPSQEALREWFAGSSRLISERRFGEIHVLEYEPQSRR